MEEEEIGRKRYARELGELLADVDDDTLAHFTKLEHALDNNTITKEIYVKELKNLFIGNIPIPSEAKTCL